ncbi:MAG: HAMP domain-containing histidine kinase [Microcoleus sp. SM1_3_4]|nr:HAMP domain-containing histidine kinase [Microcoleus sp. SM1_3_4]
MPKGSRWVIEAFKPVGKGTGLGLAIARQIIVEKHGGAIEVNSQLGQGTTFTIQMPIAA